MHTEGDRLQAEELDVWPRSKKDLGWAEAQGMLKASLGATPVPPLQFLMCLFPGNE